MTKPRTNDCHELEFPIYARIFNEVVTRNGFDDSHDDTIEHYWRIGTDPVLAAEEMIAECEDLEN